MAQSSITATFADTDAIEPGRVVYYRRMTRSNSHAGMRSRTESRGASSQSEGSWRRGVVTSVASGGRICSVRDKDTSEEVQNIPVHPLRLLPDSLTASKGIPDMVELDVLHEAAMMENVEIRYDSDLIYTKVGPILISVNPYKIIPKMYTEERRRQYIDKSDSSPHLYGVADETYTSVMQGKNQSILITGESGAGKTEATKIIIQYLLEKGAHSASSSSNNNANDANDASSSDMSEIIRKRILDSNPILEAFGNAKTIRNDNSSRFGKFFELYCNDEGNIAGANITRYLLEKSRVVSQAKGERNYHVFYQLCASKKYAHVLHNKRAQDFHYLNQSGCYEVEEIEEETSFEYLEQALLHMGVSEEHCTNLFKILAAILHLGNIDFKNNASDYAELLNEDSLIACAELLEVSPARLRSALLQRTMRAGAQRNRSGSVFKVPLDMTDAKDSRDAIAKELYANIFDLLFKWINRAIDVCRDKARWIGVLDIFGFEDMNVNSFEQLCINFANEKLHEFFVTHFFELEKRIYQEEGISTDHIVYVDNHACVEMIEAKRTGLLSILDEDCRLKTSTDKSFVEKANMMLKKSEYFDVNRFDPILFTVTHYAGLINYDATGFLAKNRDRISSDLENVILSTANPVLQMSNTIHSTSDDTHKSTVGSTFRAQLFSLMGKLGESTPHYVRCIKPNSKKATSTFFVSMVLQQLRYSGVLESIHIRKAGYVSRFDKKEFCERFHVLCSGIDESRVDERCKAIINKVKTISWKEVKIGKSKIFFRKNFLPFIQQEVARFLQEYVVLIQKVYRGWRVRRQMIIKRRAIRMIQAHGKRWRPFKRFQRVKRSILLIQKLYRGYRVRKMVKMLQEQIRADNRRRQMATLNESLASMELAVSKISEREAVKIQRAWRRHMEVKRRSRAVAAAITIQTHWRGTKVKRQQQELRQQMRAILGEVVDTAVAQGEEYYERLHRSARVIQNFMRRVRRWKQEKDSATIIQGYVRDFIERRRREKEENLKLLAEELFGKNLQSHFGSKSSAAAKMRAIKGPFRTGTLAVNVYDTATGDLLRTAEDAYALVLPGRVAVFEGKSCEAQIASFPLESTSLVAMDEGSLHSDDFRHKIKLSSSQSDEVLPGGEECVVAFRTIKEQNEWFKELMREKFDATERAETAGAAGNAGEETSASHPARLASVAQGWLTTQHDTRIFGVRFDGGILGFQSTACTEVAVLIPIEHGVTTVTHTESARWFALNNQETSDVLFADNAADMRMWMRTFPPSPTRTALLAGSCTPSAAPSPRALLLEGFLSVYQSRGVATTTAATSPSSFSISASSESGTAREGWLRMYAVMDFTHISFYSDAMCRAPPIGSILLHNVYVHPTDKRTPIDTGADGVEYAFRINRPGVTQIMMATSTSAEAHAWISAINAIGSDWVKSRKGKHTMSELSYWNEGEHYSKDGIGIVDDGVLVRAQVSPSSRRMETPQKVAFAPPSASPMARAAHRGPVASPPAGGSAGWQESIQGKLLHTPYWSSSPEIREMRLRSLKKEVGLESMLRRT